MLRVLTLASLYPTRERPGFGIFVERQTHALAALPEVEVQVVSPVGLPPWPLSLHPHFSGPRRLPERETLNGISVHRPRFRSLPGPLRRRNGKAMAEALIPFLRELRKSFEFDAVDAEFFWPDGVAAGHLAGALGVPFSIKARGSDVHYWGGQSGIRSQIVETGRSADGLIAVSAALKEDMARLGLPRAKIRVHHTGVDLELFRPMGRASAKRKLGVEGPLLVSVGALIPLKGQRLVIDALDHLPGATLILVGDGPERDALEREAARHGGRVRFLGERPQSELPELLTAADAMVLPSEREGLANVWVEALACGTPIVISDAGGALEVVDRPEAGRITARDPSAIAEAVKAILAHPPEPGAVRKAAERFSWERNSRELFEHLSGLVQGH